jgi:hypothetical protein
MTPHQELIAYAGFAGRVQDAAERAGSLVELQNAIKAALTQLRADTYPRRIGTLDGADVWEDGPGAYWIDRPGNPGYLHSSQRPRLDGERQAGGDRV